LPHGGIFGIVRKLDHPIKRIARLLLALEDIDKQRNDASGYEPRRRQTEGTSAN